MSSSYNSQEEYQNFDNSQIYLPDEENEYYESPFDNEQYRNSEDYQNNEYFLDQEIDYPENQAYNNVHIDALSTSSNDSPNIEPPESPPESPPTNEYENDEFNSISNENEYYPYQVESSDSYIYQSDNTQNIESTTYLDYSNDNKSITTLNGEHFSQSLLPSRGGKSLSLVTTLDNSSNEGIRPSQSLKNALHLRHLSRNRSSTQSLIPFLPTLPQQAETRDNLVMPAYKHVYDGHGPERITQSWLYTRRNISNDYKSKGSGENYRKLTPTEIGFEAKQLERAMPVPASSVYLTSTIKLSDSNAISDSNPLHSSETENTTKILYPDTIGQLLRSYMINQIDADEDLVEYLKKFITFSDHEMIAQHQIKAQSIFVDYLTSIGNLIQAKETHTNTSKKSDTLGSSNQFDSLKRRVDKTQTTSIITKKELEFLKLNQREDISPGICPSLQISTHCLTFNTTYEQPAQIDKTITTEIIIKNKKKQTVICQLKNVQSPLKKYSITFDSSKIELKKNQTSKISISFQLKDFLPKINDFLTLEITGGARHYIGISVFGQAKPQFGVNPEETEQTYFEGFGEMPKVLIHLFNLYTELAGSRRVGIFRRAGHETRMKQFKLQLNRGEYPRTDDYNSVANLIKIWFRELPTKIFDHIDPETLIQIDAEDPDVCASLLDEIPEPYRRLFNWLLSLMADVAENCEENKMDPKNLAIVFSPNLYSSNSGNPGIMIMITQKLSQLVCSLIKYFIEYHPYHLPKDLSVAVDSFVDPEYITDSSKTKTATNEQDPIIHNVDPSEFTSKETFGYEEDINDIHNIESNEIHNIEYNEMNDFNETKQFVQDLIENQENTNEYDQEYFDDEEIQYTDEYNQFNQEESNLPLEQAEQLLETEDVVNNDEQFFDNDEYQDSYGSDDSFEDD